MKLCGVIVLEDRGQSGVARDGARLPALENVANRPILEHVLDALLAAGVEEVVLASPAAVAAEARHGLAAPGNREEISVRCLELESGIDLAEALRIAEPIVGDRPCIVHRATGLLDEPLMRFVSRLRDSPDLILVVHQASRPEEHLRPATQDMLYLAELDADHALGMAGVWLFGPGALPVVASSPWVTGDNVDLTALGARLTAAHGSLHVEFANCWHQYRGDPAELLELNRIVLDRLDAGLRRPSNNGNRIEGRVWIHEAASVHSSVIVGPTVIGPGARIADSYIGPYTSIGERARVEGAEVERSIISAGASVQHVGGRLVASVVGRDARVFRDFSLPRALRLRVGEGTEVALC